MLPYQRSASYWSVSGLGLSRNCQFLQDTKAQWRCHFFVTAAVIKWKVLMPLKSIRTEFPGESGREEIFSEYLCDWPNCGKVAEHVLSVVRELGRVSVVCREHAPKSRNPTAGHAKIESPFRQA
jgi:hypothetical protein